MFEFGALGLVSIISLSSELEIMYHFCCWIPYSLKNSLTKFENFLLNGSTGWEPAHSVRRILIKVHYWRRFKFGAPKFVLVISPSSELRITLSFFFFFWFPYSSRNILSKFQKFSQSARLVGIRFNRFIESACIEH